MLRPVDYKNLGAEELGGVYESLLALTPQISADGARFTFAEFAGNERKTSGSYYTPDSLVQCLLDSALDPVVEEAIKGKTGAEAEKAILALKVCDPAVGSGHFLVGAAHRLARHLARVRALAQGESEPSPLLYQHALRDVIGRCLYGVDINPMAAELCQVSLWLEALEPGKPLRSSTTISGRQQPARRHAGADRRRHPRRGLHRHRGRRQEGLRGAEEAQQGRAQRAGAALRPAGRRDPGPPAAGRRRAGGTARRPARGHPRQGTGLPPPRSRPRNTATRSSSPTPGAPPSSSEVLPRAGPRGAAPAASPRAT